MFKDLFLKLKIMASVVWDFLKPIILEFLKDSGKELANAALEVVTSLSASDITNEEKRAEAFKRITEKLKAKGIEIRDSLINTAIEIAVQKLKQ